MTHLKEKKKKTIALTGWATGGHIFPLLSVYNYLKEDDSYRFIWAWEQDGLEEKIASDNDIKFLDVPAWKLRRYFDWRNFYEPLKNLTWFFFWIYYILRYNIKIVFSKWGYVSIPLCLAAFVLWRKIYIHESDSTTWVANKLIWALASKVFYSFDNEKIDGKKHILTGQLLNPALLDNVKESHIWVNTMLTILVIGWSQWSTRIFDSLVKILPDLSDIKFNIVLWEKNTSFKEDFSKFNNVNTYDFVDQVKMWEILKSTDIAITRWWATTLWELCAFGIHSIIIPLPESAWDHQNKNASYFKEKYESDILDESNDLEMKLFKRLQKYKNLRKTGLNLDWFFKPLQVIEAEIKK